ncbi:hypothetical protein [Acidianus sp. HS-5]|uniref:hypothetical protein n=1 Tax=Acidianus sp. HS-5 TaxID=2886040 RepID=UPI001F2FEC8D|nr:hypothetical protein [Acidianus sp. HS-5]BDC19425.1 hypothetical protein HS5_23150 [Acidianus sp. HS-5]
MQYIEEVTIPIGKTFVNSILSNPYYVSGILGHVSLLKVYDKAKNDYFPPSEVKEADNKFLSALVLQDEKGRVIVYQGEFAGPNVLPNYLEYNLKTDDGKIEIKLNFQLQEKVNGTKINIGCEFTQRRGFFDFFSKNYGKFDEHLVRGHIVPFLNSLLTKFAVMRKIYEETLGLDDALIKLRELPKTSGIIMIKGDSLDFTGYFNEDGMIGSELNYNEKVYNNADALAALFKVKSENVKMVIYELPIHDIKFNF